MTIVVGLPVPQDGKLFNCAAVVQAGRLLGVVPKTYLPGYKEYYEERWFASSRESRRSDVTLLGQSVPFGTDLLFTVEDEPSVTLGVEICEDLWATVSPSSFHAMAGATVLANLSASNELVAKAEYRRELVKVQSGRAVAAYIYANNGVHESTTDVVFGGQLLIAENAVLLAEGQRFRREGELIVTDVDTERLTVERMRQTSFADGVHILPEAYRRHHPRAHPAPRAAHACCARWTPILSCRPTPPSSTSAARRSSRSRPRASAKRLEHTGIKRVILGLSGGLDSTLALLVVDRAFDLLSLPARGHPGRDHARVRHHRRARCRARASWPAPPASPSARSTSGPRARST